MKQTNFGATLKIIAKWIFLVTSVVEMLGGTIGALLCLAEGDEELILVALGILAGTAFMVLMNYVTYLLLAGFGQLVENSDIMVGRLEASTEPTTLKEYQKKDEATKKGAAQTPNEKKFEVLQNLLAQGLITQDEFKKEVDKLK